MQVSNMLSNNGNKIANQFIIENGETELFQSYETPIAKKDNQGYTISSNYNYSVTTGKYFNIWLRGWGFNDTEIKSLKKWLANAKDGDNLVELLSGRVNIKFVDEL